MSNVKANLPLSRRKFLMATAAGSAAALMSAPSRTFAADTKLTVRTSSGGSYGAAMEEAIFAPFTAKTGIQIEKISIDMAPLMASGAQGRPLADLIETTEGILQNFAGRKALLPIDYSAFTSFKIEDIGADSAQEFIVRRMVYARVLGYRKSAFADGVPGNWAEFWDVEKFPGARALCGLDLNMPDLEFALLATGVPMNEIYPIDIERALEAYSRIRNDIQTFYGTDAISANLLSTGEVDLEPISNGRIQGLIDEGGDFAIEWNQHMKMPSGYAVMNGSKNVDAAYQFIDFAMSPEVQARFAELIPYGPVNSKAFDLISPDAAKTLPTNPEWTDKGFMQNTKWWGDNTVAVTEAWNQWSAQ